MSQISKKEGEVGRPSQSEEETVADALKVVIAFSGDCR